MAHKDIYDAEVEGIWPAGEATPRVRWRTADGIMIAYGTTVPTDGVTGYATSCDFFHTDGGNATARYINEGSVTSADFNAIIVA